MNHHCPLCDHQTSSVSHALRHMNRSHGIVPDRNTYTCARCRQPFPTAQEADQHVQQAHLTQPALAA